MKRLAVIDIGTHSILYLLVEINPKNGVFVIDQIVRAVRLGRGVEDSGMIQDDPLKKAVHVLKDFVRQAFDQHVDQVIAVGTHVFRAAKNREQVREAIRKKTGLNIEVLSDREEARWSYLGAVYGRELDRSVLVVDIGGGSTEFIFGEGNQIEDLVSINLGAVNLTERCIHHDPPLKEEMNALTEVVYAMLPKSIYTFYQKGKQLIATGGTVTTLGALQLRSDRYDPNRVNGYVMSLEDLEDSMDQLLSVPISERKRLLRFDPARSDIILAGSMILKTILLAGKFKEVMISDQGLRLGIALRAFKLDSLHHQ
ncbi:Ppx/GppA family phosphatase [bacterium]|nr:Ppx/GppA family phosphatase [bacterium]